MAIFAELIVESRVVVVVVAVVVARMRWMVHITLNGYTGAAERRPRRDARPLHTGTTLFRSVPLSRFTLSPLSCRRRRTDSLSFYLFLPLYSLLRSLLSTAGTSLFCSFDRLLFSVSVIDDSPFDPLCDSGTSRSLPPSLTLSLLFASLSSIVGLEAPRICPCCSQRLPTILCLLFPPGSCSVCLFLTADT